MRRKHFFGANILLRNTYFQNSANIFHPFSLPTRFGEVKNGSGGGGGEGEPAKKVTTNPGTNSVVLDEKMKKRAERFGVGV